MTAHLSDKEKGILSEIQRDIPLSSRPFRDIGNRIGISEPDCLERLQFFLDHGLLREISAIYNAGALGYKSTLIAAAVPPDRIEQAASLINEHPGVSHNYLREHRYNIWFTLTILNDRGFEPEITGIDKEQLFASFLILPALRTFKLGVHFDLAGNSGGTPAPLCNESALTVRTSSALNENGRIPLLKELQKPFPITKNPWEIIAERTGMKEQELFDEIEGLKTRQVIRRIAGVLRHRSVGFKANGMACFTVPEHRVEEAGHEAARFPEVSHCYQRPVFPDWPYSLFAMVHNQTSEKCEEIIKTIGNSIGCTGGITLFSTREFKKERVKYFMEDS